MPTLCPGVQTDFALRVNFSVGGSAPVLFLLHNSIGLCFVCVIQLHISARIVPCSVRTELPPLSPAKYAPLEQLWSVGQDYGHAAQACHIGAPRPRYTFEYDAIVVRHYSMETPIQILISHT